MAVFLLNAKTFSVRKTHKTWDSINSKNVKSAPRQICNHRRDGSPYHFRCCDARKGHMMKNMRQPRRTIKERSTWTRATTNQRREVTATDEDSLMPWTRHSRLLTSRGRSDLPQTPQGEFVREFGPEAVTGHGGNPNELLNQSTDTRHEVLDQLLLRWLRLFACRSTKRNVGIAAGCLTREALPEATEGASPVHFVDDKQTSLAACEVEHQPAGDDESTHPHPS